MEYTKQVECRNANVEEVSQPRLRIRQFGEKMCKRIADKHASDELDNMTNRPSMLAFKE